MQPPVHQIADDESVWRYVSEEHIVTDPATGRTRLSSAAFSDSSDGSPMSVVVEPVADQLNLVPAGAMEGRPKAVGVLALNAGALRGEGQTVTHTPIVDAPEPHPCDPAHGSVAGRKSKSMQRRWAKAPTWLIRPEGLTA